MKGVGSTRLRAILIGLVVLIAVVAVSFKTGRRAGGLAPRANGVWGTSSNRVSEEMAGGRKSMVVIQMGEERMTNAIRSMAYVVDLADALPKENSNLKRLLLAEAGVLFFDDCLMARMKDRYITTTAMLLRQNFAYATGQLFTNDIPREVTDEFNAYDPKNIGAAMLRHGQLLEQYPSLAVVDGFNNSFRDRDNLHLSLAEQYQRMAQSPDMATMLNALDSAFHRGGIADADQSDLKELCLFIGESRTSGRRIFESTAEYQIFTDSVDKILKWRLINIYGLDAATAQELVESLSHVPIDGFSSGGLQPPAFIQ